MKRKINYDEQEFIQKKIEISELFCKVFDFNNYVELKDIDSIFVKWRRIKSEELLYEIQCKTYLLTEILVNKSSFEYKDSIKSGVLKYFFDKFNNDGFRKMTVNSFKGLIYLKIKGVGIDIYRKKGIDVMEDSYDMAILSDTGMLSDVGGEEDLELIKKSFAISENQKSLEAKLEHPLLNYNSLISAPVKDLIKITQYIITNGLKRNEAEFIIEVLRNKKTEKNVTHYRKEVIPNLVKNVNFERKNQSKELDNINTKGGFNIKEILKKNALKMRHIDFDDEYTEQETHFLTKGFAYRNKADYLRKYNKDSNSVNTDYFKVRIEEKFAVRVKTLRSDEIKALELLYYFIAIFQFKKVIERTVTNWMADQNIGYCYLKSSNFIQAVGHFSLMVTKYEKLEFSKKNEKLSTTYESFAEVYKNVNYDYHSYENSIMLMEKSIEYLPLAIDLHCAYIDVCCKNEDALKAYDFVKSISDEKEQCLFNFMMECFAEDINTKVCFHYIYKEILEFKKIVDDKLNGLIDPDIFFKN